MKRLSASLAALLVVLAIVALTPPARASSPITLTAWGGALAGSTCNPPPTMNQYLNITMSSTVASGSFIVLFLQAGWQTTALNITPSDDGGTSYGIASASYKPMPDIGGGGWCVGYSLASYVFTGRVANSMTTIFTHSNSQPGNAQYFEVIYAAVYANATGIGGRTLLATTQNTGWTNKYVTTTMTQDDSALAFLSVEIMDTLGNGCPQVGTSNAQTLGSLDAYSYITFNTTAGGGLPTPYGYYNGCTANKVGMRAVDAGALALVNGQTYTMTFNMFASGDNSQIQSAEILGTITLPFGIGNYVLLFMFFAVLSTAVILTYQFVGWRRAHGH